MIIISPGGTVDMQMGALGGSVVLSDTIVRGITRQGGCAFLRAFIIRGAPN